MFKDLDWRSAFKRAAVFTAIWLGLVYVLNTVSPGTFSIGGWQQIYALAINAVLFFFLYALLFAFFEKRRRDSGRGQQTKARNRGEEEKEPGPLKGRHNPNTSRKKARRRSRR